MFHEKTTVAAKGKWRGILLELGMPEQFLRDKHGPCPLCKGKDRYRWDNKGGAGTYICSQCGAGDGMKLAMEFTGEPFPVLASRIDQIIRNVKLGEDKPRFELSDADRRRQLLEIWLASQVVRPGDLAHKYLETRGIEELVYPAALRSNPSMRDGEGGVRPCMIAMVGVHGQVNEKGQQTFVSAHRTFLKPDGSGKAEMAAPRKMMPGSLPEGACVMLSDYYGGPIGIAEGIETAMSASAHYSMPVWAALNTSILAKWWPPNGCTEVVIFGDNDRLFGGQSAAYALAHRLAVKGFDAKPIIPQREGDDWNDVWQRDRCRKAC
ncbi:toprim domain-containing protein [Cereibacter azotoformans]|uniref:Helicase domain protein n=1 Tax=Cereibacter sphaeroides (strain ATCC 17025 / ATH 2.4.3) TaxID=349102 RepID=A4WYZ7_CERS5|nr:toprim domain-containing protein [Cereibacter azotoformans]ULB11266.1 toprim domain-containing protein [Cereibacter azotoformans]